MLEINMEYRKGILFVRFIGSLNKRTLKNLYQVDEVLNKGISCVVFNLQELVEIDERGIDSLWEEYQIVKKYGGVAFLCGIYNRNVKRRLKRSRILTYMNEIQDELILLHQN